MLWYQYTSHYCPTAVEILKNVLMSPTLFEIKRLCSKVVTGALQDTTGNPNQHQNLLSQFVTHTVSQADPVTLLAANWLPHK